MLFSGGHCLSYLLTSTHITLSLKHRATVQTQRCTESQHAEMTAGAPCLPHREQPCAHFPSEQGMPMGSLSLCSTLKSLPENTLLVIPILYTLRQAAPKTVCTEPGFLQLTTVLLLWRGRAHLWVWAHRNSLSSTYIHHQKEDRLFCTFTQHPFYSGSNLLNVPPVPRLHVTVWDASYLYL